MNRQANSKGAVVPPIGLSVLRLHGISGLAVVSRSVGGEAKAFWGAKKRFQRLMAIRFAILLSSSIRPIIPR
jgi:hypothetical protein